MKLFLILISMVCLLDSSALGQTDSSKKNPNSPDALTRIEDRLLASGELIEVRLQSVGALKSKGLLASTTFLNVEVITVLNLFTNSKLTGVKLSLPAGSSYGKFRGEAIYLDSDEVELMVKSLDKINSEIVKSTSKEDSNVMFISRSGFMVGCRSNNGKWNPFLRLSKNIPDSEVSWFSINELETFSTLLKQALTKLS